MIKYFTADYILPVSSPPIKKGVVAVDLSGEITGIYTDTSAEIKDKDIQKFEGIIVPGFINAHCHLELSYLKGQVPQKKGLVAFILEVIGKRKQVQKGIEEAMAEADQQMQENGIVAVADISNTVISKEVKQKSKIHYHTFLELLCFEPECAKDVFRDGLQLKEQFAPLKTSIVPHAPYSVCKELFRFIGKFCGEAGDLLSIHNQETEEENKFYRYKSGQFLDFYEKLGRNIDFFKPQARNSIQSVIPLLPEQQKVLLVHNTYTSLKDIYFIRRSGREVTWCFCPNANLYIEDRLPKIDMFLFNDFNIVLGTDSLASNTQLCMLSELQTLHTHFPSLSLSETMAWATLNGAKFLGVNERLGSIEKGKMPGLNLITEVRDMKLSPDSKVQKLI
ncbi:amidohydrolase family protein [Pedobacter sp. SYSU D00535]|uniref:amidohydrolase family protein n=1 Tax=Pedobacter sp. SYSU D00535 TaxID=2810308 RepID=UPI001A970119|nr:amidohydrolase family protein [Pedobacter sp. SYSU D00535]